MSGVDLLVVAVLVDSAVTLTVGVMLRRAATTAVARSADLMWRALCAQAQPLAAPFGITLDPDAVSTPQAPSAPRSAPYPGPAHVSSATVTADVT